MKFIKNMRFSRRFVQLFLVFIMLPFSLMAQNEIEVPEGELEDTEVIIEKELEIRLPTAKRAFEKVIVEEEETAELTLAYTPEAFQPELVSEQVEIIPVLYRVQTEAPENQNFISLGYGNFQSPLLEGFYRGTISDKSAYTALFQHESFARGPVQDEVSGESANQLDLNLDTYLKDSKLSSGIDWTRRGTHYYGQPDSDALNADSIRQIFNLFDFSVGLGRPSSEKIGYKANIESTVYSDNFERSEFELGADFSLSKPINEDIDFSLLGTTSLSEFKTDSLSLNRNYVHLKPSLAFKAEKFVFTFEASYVNTNDTIFETKNFFLPEVSIDFWMNPLTVISAGIRNEVLKRTYADYKQENNFIGNTNPVNDKLIAYWLAGETEVSKIRISSGVSYAMYDVLNSFTNNVQDPGFFDIAAFKDINVFNFNLGAKGEVSRKLSTGMKLNFYDYSSLVLHQPTFRGDFNMSYAILDDLLLGTILNFQSGRKALDEDLNTLTLSSIADLGIDLKYSISPDAKVFLTLDNVLGNRTEYYRLYQGRSQQVSVGFSYFF